MTFLDWFINQYNRAAIWSWNNLVLLAVDLIDYTIAIDRKATLDNNVICWHCCRCFAPTTEAMTLLGRYVNQYNLTAIWSWNNLVLLAVDLVDYTIAVDCEATLDNNVICWHGRRSFTPATEGMTLLGWGIAQNNLTTKCNTVCCPYFVVYLIYEVIRIWL